MTARPGKQEIEKPDAARPVPRAIEIGFPIVEINRLAKPERNSFKPIYQMHKWFARRASCVFRAILLGALKPAYGADGRPTDLMEEFYRNHAEDPDTRGVHVLDPFMGGGTTVVEALRLGCKVTGIDLNPVAWFIVKTQVEPVDIDKLKEAFERLARFPVFWNGGRPLRESLLELYKTEIEPGVEADTIYTFWVKHAVCTECSREVPLFKDYLIAQKTMTVRYHRDVLCPACRKAFDWEIEPGTLIADKRLMVNAPRGSAGEGRPAAKWTHAPEPEKPRGRARSQTLATLGCPHCEQTVRVQVPWDRRKERKKVPLTVLFCPACEAVWQWRGALPEGEVACPACRHRYDPYKGNVPKKGVFDCRCGNQDKIIASIRTLPKDRRLTVRPYAIQAYLPPGGGDEEENDPQSSMFGDSAAAPPMGRWPTGEHWLIPKNGKFFKGISPSDLTRLQKVEALWDQSKQGLPYPKSAIPKGAETARLLEHHYRHWHEMFNARQLLALSTLLQGIIGESSSRMQEMLLCAFSDCIGRNNQFCRYFNARNTIQEIFARHDFQPKVTTAEGSVFGPDDVRGTYPQMITRLIEGKKYLNHAFDWTRTGENEPKAIYCDRRVFSEGANVICGDSSEAIEGIRAESLMVITDPPYVGNVNYAELADFFYVWERLALKARYASFAAELTPKGAEIVKNVTRGKTQDDFDQGLLKVFTRVHDVLPSKGLLTFTFHHTDQEGTVWQGLLRSICEAGFEIYAIYPIHAEKESSLHLVDKANVSYDLIHVCRKRREDPTPRSWAGIRQEVRRRAREELRAIEAGRYGNEPLPEPDVRLVCIGKCLELYSAHYGHVLDYKNDRLPLREALQDIGTIVDQLVTRERPLPVELEAIDPLSYAWLRILLPRHTEMSVDKVSKGLRGMQISVEDLKRAGLVTRGRTGRGRSYTVKQPRDRLEEVLKRLNRAWDESAQGALFADDTGRGVKAVALVDLLHGLIALADSGESVLPVLERFRSRQVEILAGLRFAREARPDWVGPIDRVVAIIEGAPLLRKVEGG
jgi:hypothetical protein